MIRFPKELISVTFLDEDGNRKLSDNATEKQKEIFENFYKTMNNKDLDDEFIVED